MVIQSFGQIAMQTLQRLHPNELFTADDSSSNIKTLFGQAITHFSHPSQSSTLMSMCESSSVASSCFLSFLKNDLNPNFSPR